MTINLWDSEKYPNLISLNTAHNNDYVNGTANWFINPLMGRYSVNRVYTKQS